MDKTYSIDNINKTVIISFEYDESLLEAVKLLDRDAHWNQEFKHWVIPVNEWSRDNIVRFVKLHGFQHKALEKEQEVKWDYSVPPEDLLALKGMVQKKDFEYEARDYQLHALAYAIDNVNIINGDDVGLGKTFEAIIYAEVTESFPCLVVVPASVKYNWKREWDKITKGKRETAVIESRPKKKNPNNWDADVIFINYDILAKKVGTGATYRFEELKDIDWRMVIFDEAHFLKNGKSQRSKVAGRISNGDLSVQLLTGTATMNKPVELWNLLKLVNSDEYIANDWHHFITRYCGGYRGKFGWVTDGATNTMELNKLLRENCYIRREKSEVLEELPNFISQRIEIPISNERAYTKAEDDIIEFLRETQGEEKAEKAMQAEHLVALSTLRKMSSEGKIKAVEGYLKDWKESGRKLLVFGLHTEGLEYLSKKFKCPLINGNTSAKRKFEIKEEWIVSDDIFLFGNMSSMGTGTDGLQKVCSDAIIYELPWRPSDLTQAIGRIHRSGQTVPPVITYLTSPKTIDLDMWGMLEEKEQVTDAVNKGVDVKRTKSGMKAVIRKLLKRKS